MIVRDTEEQAQKLRELSQEKNEELITKIESNHRVSKNEIDDIFEVVKNQDTRIADLNAKIDNIINLLK